MEYQSGAVRPIGSIEEGWRIIKDDYWIYVLMMLVLGVVLIVVSLVLGAINQAITTVLAGALGMAASGSGDVARTSAAILPQVIAQIVSFFTNIAVVTLSGVLLCGIYKSLSKVANGGGRADFGDLFSGFEYIQSCFIYAVVISVVQFIIAIVTLVIAAAVGVGALGLGLSGMITKDGQFNPAIFGGLFLVILAFAGISIVINLIISALTAFVYPLIAERNLSGGQALMTSIKSGIANLGGLILLMILLFLMVLGGVMACFIGVLFVSPLLAASIFAAYQSVFGKVGGFRQHNPPPPPNFGQQPGY
jgi:hypothetical protein